MHYEVYESTSDCRYWLIWKEVWLFCIFRGVGSGDSEVLWGKERLTGSQSCFWPKSMRLTKKFSKSLGAGYQWNVHEDQGFFNTPAVMLGNRQHWDTVKPREVIVNDPFSPAGDWWVELIALFPNLNLSFLFTISLPHGKRPRNFFSRASKWNHRCFLCL